MIIKNKFLALVLFVLGINVAVSQGTFDITFPGNNDIEEKCKTCFEVFSQKTKEIQFSIVRENTSLYFQINDKVWFDKLFKNPGDGIAVDIVLKDRYNCGVESVEKTQIRGLLLKPVYTQKLKSGLRLKEENTYRVFVGTIPDRFLKKELEFNILFLSNKNLCEYYSIYDLESYPWDLLDMGMYLDDIEYNPKKIKTSNTDSYALSHRTLKFRIPFRKGKSQYLQKDIKPIYDSLRLINFNIKSVKIKAYSSVEGGLNKNIELQKNRANSILKALQMFQKSKIETEISTSENWVEFFNDIKGTKYEYLVEESKSEVRSKLVGALSNDLEPVLRNHRKALLVLELEKKNEYNDTSADGLLSKFNTAIEAEKLSEAMKIQNSIFEKIKSNEISPDFLKKMNIPKQTKFIRILNKNAAYRYILDGRQALIVYNKLLELEKLAPNNKEVKYNIVAVKIRLWDYKAIDIDEAKLKNDIIALKNYNIDNSLISRMLVNFHIIKATGLMRTRDYLNKDKSVSFINDNYKKFSLSDYDYLSLAQFFSYYGDTAMSVKLLENKAKSIDIDEDLLFYYLNLTIVDAELTQDTNYRIIMLNAVNMDKKRYCKLFNSVANGGVTFQLLEDQYLRDTYCESCNN